MSFLCGASLMLIRYAGLFSPSWVVTVPFRCVRARLPLETDGKLFPSILCLRSSDNQMTRPASFARGLSPASQTASMQSFDGKRCSLDVCFIIDSSETVETHKQHWKKVYEWACMCVWAVCVYYRVHASVCSACSYALWHRETFWGGETEPRLKYRRPCLKAGGCGWRRHHGWMSGVWIAVWGVTRCAQALRAPVAGWTRESARMDDPLYPCGVWLVQLHLIGQEQRAALHQGVWHSTDTIRNTKMRLASLRLSSVFSVWASLFPTLRRTRGACGNMCSEIQNFPWVQSHC